MTEICVERCCTGNSVFCEECDSGSHRNNSLMSLFHNSLVVRRVNRHKKDVLGALLKHPKTANKEVC